MPLLVGVFPADSGERKIRFVLSFSAKLIWAILFTILWLGLGTFINNVHLNGEYMTFIYVFRPKKIMYTLRKNVKVGILKIRITPKFWNFAPTMYIQGI